MEMVIAGVMVAMVREVVIAGVMVVVVMEAVTVEVMVAVVMEVVVSGVVVAVVIVVQFGFEINSTAITDELEDRKAGKGRSEGENGGDVEMKDKLKRGRTGKRETITKLTTACKV